MFEGLSNWELVDFMGEESRAESAAIAARLAAVAELFVRTVGPLDEREWWCADHCDGVAAQVSAVQNISHARAVGQVQYACALRHRLPRVAAVFARGYIDFRVVATVLSRTENVEDDLMPALDEAIACHVEKWMKLSTPKLRDRVDQWVAKFDPAAVRVPPKVRNNRYVDFWSTSPGMAGMSGSLTAADAAAMDQRLDAIAATVCDDDPRTTQQRRSDACGALGCGQATLACQCGLEHCPARAQRDAAAAAVIHVLAEQATVEGTSDMPGYLPGFGVMPAESVRELAATATLTPLKVPADESAEQRYRPSAKLVEFLRWRDLTCCWPGCDRPVDKSDIDHTVAWPLGLTHPSNTKHYCRIHHLIKTFHPGWRDQQMADGTIVLTDPTGHTYCTQAHSAAMFPALARTTGELDDPPYPAAEAHRTAMMPRRKQTREQNRGERIKAERRERSELIAEEERQRQEWLAANYEPPPF